MMTFLIWQLYGLYDFIQNLHYILIALGFFTLVVIVVLFIKGKMSQRK